MAAMGGEAGLDPEGSPMAVPGGGLGGGEVTEVQMASADAGGPMTLEGAEQLVGASLAGAVRTPGR